MSDPNSRNNLSEFVRAVLCAMMISMLFSFVMTYLGANGNWSKVPKAWGELLLSLAQGKGVRVWYAGVWMLFYLGYMIDDYLYVKNDL